ncbi:MAG: DUF2059 domain-containing protein [Salinarimonas sp.]
MLRPLLAASTLAVALALAGAATSGARAQTEATPAAQAQLSESHLALAREVVASSGMARSFEAVIPQMQEALLRQYGRNPVLIDDAAAVIQALEPEMELQRRAMLNRAARVIAARLSEEALADIAAFFDSEAGQRYVEVQPAVLDGLISEMQVWSRELNEYLQIRVQAEMLERREAQAAGGGEAPAQ